MDWDGQGACAAMSASGGLVLWWVVSSSGTLKLLQSYSHC